MVSYVFHIIYPSVKLTGEYGFHLIRVDEKAYVASAEVSLLIWKDDLVRTKVCSTVGVEPVLSFSYHL
jgi:hypothetical protein